MKRTLATALIVLIQSVLIGLAIAPQASARLTGETYMVRVGPVDPIDPYRGAYVALDYPDLQVSDDGPDGLGVLDDGERGPVYVTLRADGDVWVADGFNRSRPDGGHYLTCSDQGWQIDCGIDSWFLPQEKVLEMEADLSDGAYAELKVDGRGNAALVDVRGTID